jgi:hypothetical protein
VLLNPSQHRWETIPGTRFLASDLGLSGKMIRDPLSPWRCWWIQWVLAPVEGRHLGGLRAKLIDEKSFITFINQRDLEVLLGHGRPGEYCPWLGKDYVGHEDRDWYGLCCDDEDLRDDLFERECRLREQHAEWPWLPQGLEIRRRIHLDHQNDVEDLDTLLWDMNPDTGVYPDPRLEMVQRRWVRVERTRLSWERTLVSP